MILKDTSNGGPLFRTEQGSHFYYPDGTPCHQVPYAASNKAKAGQTRDTNLTDAKKLGLLPSVTQLLRMLDKPGLNNWRCEMAVIAALTLPMEPGELPDDFARRIVKDADTMRDTAADLGRRLHRAAEDYARAFSGLAPAVTPEEDLAPFVGHLEAWFDQNIETVISVEEVVVSLEHGFAGMRDLKAIHKTHGLVHVDFKTQGVKPGKSVMFYREWLLQLAAYQIADPDQEPSKLLSVGINSKQPELSVEHVWPEDEVDRAERSVKLIAELWRIEKNYFPGA